MTQPQAFLADLNPVINRLKTLAFEPTHLTLEGKSYPWMHYKFSFTLDSPILSLSSPLAFPKILWHEKDTGYSSIHFGSTLSFSHIPTFSPNSHKAPLDFFYIQDFGKRKTNLWSTLPNKLCFLPLISLHQTFFLSRANTVLLKANFFSLEDIKRAIAFLESLNSHGLTPPQTPLSKNYLPSKLKWKKQIERAKTQIEKQVYDKVVLSRLASLHFEKPIDTYSTLTRLLTNPGQGTAFCFAPDNSTSFLGLTPEILYKRLGSQLNTMALAGTIGRGKTEREDNKLAKKLLASAKDFHEFDLVRIGITQALKKLCIYTDTPFGPVSVLKTAHVQHLFSPIKRTLMPGVNDQTLITALHPTPAISGWPKTASMAEIFRSEQFDRGYFSAPVGFISPSQTQIHVAIRSALITDNTLHLFSGAGITAQSDPQKEWDELESKLRPFLSTLKIQ
ncbi:hypothetical protein COB21_05375 [Candidatus Aerophobetes bacterium]|uniref:isochorismate synthase n=1 Tax=Aerophobetes bacterium TaxID=2030807 RepID=A0A2A4X0V8_UNCAE|nr:MAG: hypothetical protein COB21_05375 [Candidatus Aerophobetes bacterium]